LSGDVVIVTGMPLGSIFGLDTVSFTLGKDGHFEGVRDIPNGPHFVHGSSSSELSTRTGFWIMSQRTGLDDHGEIFVKRWDSYSETLEDELSAAEARIQQENVPKIFNRLMPYTTKAPGARESTYTARGPQSFTKHLGIGDPNIWNRLTFAAHCRRNQRQMHL
jgi:A1 cistron-splicing factor AAR2